MTSEFAAAEIADPRPDITARIMASIHSGHPVLASRDDVARANAGHGVDVVILYSAWRDEILNPAARHDVQTLLATSFTEVLAGFPIARILAETTTAPVTEFHRRSVEHQAIAEFPELERAIHLMTFDSATTVPGSLGNVIFKFDRPMLRLRDSDRQLLLAALLGATDQHLAAELGVTLSAVKARWRSTFARIAEVMPDLVSDAEGRGSQKRRRVLAHMRCHKGEPPALRLERKCPAIDRPNSHQQKRPPTKNSRPAQPPMPIVWPRARCMAYVLPPRHH